MNLTLLTLGAAEPAWLVSGWKAVILLALLGVWAWIVSTIYDKDAARFYFKRRQWNLAHVGVATLALCVGLFTPIFWIALPLMALVLLADLGVYYVMRNKDHRVPAEARWSLNFAKQVSAGAEERSKRRKLSKSEVELSGPKGVMPPPEEGTPEYEVRLIAEGFLTAALESRAVRFDVAPASESSYAVSLVVDGVRQTGDTIPSQQAVAAIDYLRALSGMEVGERRKRQSKEFTIARTGVRHGVRLVSQGVPGGLRITGTIDPDKQVLRTLDEIGLLEGQEKELRRIIDEQKGVVLLAAPPGSGRTSTMYAILRTHDAYTSNVQTLEIEPESYIDGVRHNVFDPKVDGAEFSTTVRSLLRRDPDVLAVSETPDPETAQEIARADHDRTRTYLNIRAETALQAVQIYAKAVGDANIAAKSLHGVVAFRLLRRLCPNCKAAYQPTPEMLKKLGMPDKVQQLHRKGGQVLIKNKPEICPVCNGGGYFGQDGCFEVHAIDAETRPHIAKGNFGALRDAFRKRREPSIQESALRKAMEGITSVEEVVRISTSPGGAKPKPKAPAASGAE